MFDRNSILNAVSGALAAYGWLSFCFFFYLVTNWSVSAPRQPDMSHGLIFAHNNHGTITYFSAFQGTSCAILFATSIPMVFLAIGISPKKNVLSRQGRLSFSMKWKSDDPKGYQKRGMFCGAVAAPVIVFAFGPLFVAWLNHLGVAVGF